MKVLSIIILIIIFPLFYLALFDVSLKLTVENPKFLKTEMSHFDAYGKINRNLPEIVALLGENKGDGEAPVISNVELAALLQQSLTADVLKKGTESFLDGSKSQTSKTEVQKQLSDNFDTAMRAKYDTLPVCVSEADMSDGSLCRSSEMNFDQLMTQLSAQGNNPLSMVSNVPGTTTSEADATQGQQLQKGPNLSILSNIGKFGNLTYVLSFILLLIIYFLARGYAGSWLGSGKVFGIFLAVLSVLSLLTSFLLSLFNKSIASLVSGFADKAPTLKAELIVPLFNDILDKISQMTNKISIISASVGVVLFIVFLIITKVKKKNPPEKPLEIFSTGKKD